MTPGRLFLWSKFTPVPPHGSTFVYMLPAQPSNDSRIETRRKTKFGSSSLLISKVGKEISLVTLRTTVSNIKNDCG